MCTPGVCTAPSMRARLIGRRSQRRVRRRDDDLHQRELRVGHVDRAVGADVGLDALQQPEACRWYFAFSASISRCCCSTRAIDRPPAIGKPVRMIGDGGMRVAARDPGLDDLLERLAAVAPIGMHLQIAADVGARRRIGLRDRIAASAAARLRKFDRSPRRLRISARVFGSAAFDGAIDDRRRAVAQHFEDHARRRGADAGNFLERAVGIERACRSAPADTSRPRPRACIPSGSAVDVCTNARSRSQPATSLLMSRIRLRCHSQLRDGPYESDPACAPMSAENDGGSLAGNESSEASSTRLD